GGASDRALYTVPVGEAGRLASDAGFSLAGAGSYSAPAGLPDGADPRRGGLELVFSPGIGGLLDAPLAALAAYQYFSLEQTTSKAAGALYVLRLGGRDGEGEAGPARRERLREEVARQLELLDSRSAYGGFASWPGADRPARSPELTAWVLDFLTEAREDGFEVGQELIDRAALFLAAELGRAAAAPPGGYGEGQCSLCDSDAASLYVMGAAIRAGMPLEGSVEPFYARRASLGLPERIFLLRAVQPSPPPPSGPPSSRNSSPWWPPKSRCPG
ncbi:MAG: hypothetical protein LBQ79_06365, partial [Deltaproteobacteria bacterium]|nr:hypothetical protein [Deltaproteobacteria bacterium]